MASQVVFMDPKRSQVDIIQVTNWCLCVLSQLVVEEDVFVSLHTIPHGSQPGDNRICTKQITTLLVCILYKHVLGC